MLFVAGTRLLVLGATRHTVADSARSLTILGERPFRHEPHPFDATASRELAQPRVRFSWSMAIK